MAGFDPELLAEFSQRTKDVDRRLDHKLDRFRIDLGREPTAIERWKLERESVVDSRPSKPHGPTPAELRREWQQRAQALGHDPGRLVEKVVGRQRSVRGIDARMSAMLVESALDSLSERQSTWRPAELVRELAASVPTIVTAGSEQLTDFLQRLADHAVSARCVDISRPVPTDAQLRRDGRPISESAVDRTLTTQAILDEEEQLIAWADRHRAGESARIRSRITGHAGELTSVQVESVAAVADGGGLELIVGPAGTGKTTALASAVAHLEAQGRPAFGVAPTAAAAEVLATETGMATDTLDKLLIEHRPSARPAGTAYDLPAGTTLIVDEAGTAATPKLAELARLADQKGWRVVLVGDPRQFSAVGRGGMFAHLVEAYGAVELDRVHRFRHHWERQASLRLRTGDPGVLAEYERRGRLHGGRLEEMEAEVIAAWEQARRRGETVALMANSTDTVARLNRRAQHTRIMMGELDAAASSIRVGDQLILVGDEVVTRRNDRTLRTDQGFMIKNRDHWTVTTIHPDRSVVLSGRTGTVRLPAEYVAEHLELGYAQTSHATQGRTVDTALLLVDTPTDSRGVYTPMTRGRASNHAYVATDGNQTALDVLSQTITRDWIDQPALARRAQLDPHRSRQLPDPGNEDEFDRLERHVRRLIDEHRRARDAERTTAPGLGLVID